MLHEISGPLTVIQGFSEVIRDEALSREEMQEYAADISKEAARLIESVSIEGSSFNKTRGDVYRLNATIKNHAGVEVELPAGLAAD